MIGICLSSVSVVPASAAAWNLSSPPLNFVRRVFQCHFEQGITQRNASRKPFLLRHSTSTQRLFRSVRLSDLDDSLAGLVQFAQRVVRRVFVDVAQGRIVEDRMDEEVNVAAEAQAGQSDVNQFAGELADD